MRRAVDVVCALAAVAVIAVAAFALSASFRERSTIGAAAQALDQFRRVLSIQAAAKEREHRGTGWPDTIELAWFEGEPPKNPLLSPDRPWVEVATPDQADLDDPPVRVAVSTTYAAFWYNPAKGIVRARVPLKMSEAASVALYNQVNGADIDEGYEPFTPPPPKAEPAPEPRKERGGVTPHKASPTEEPSGIEKPEPEKPGTAPMAHEQAAAEPLPAPGTPGSDLMGPPTLADVPESLDPTQPR
jgi:hypothetical protein